MCVWVHVCVYLLNLCSAMPAGVENSIESAALCLPRLSYIASSTQGLAMSRLSGFSIAASAKLLEPK